MGGKNSNRIFFVKTTLIRRLSFKPKNRVFNNFISGILVVIFLLAIVIQAQAATDFNKPIDMLAKKLTSSSKGEVLKSIDSKVYISLGQNQGILPGNRFEIVRQGEPLKIGNEVIGYEETGVAEVEVVRSREKMSICKILDKREPPKAGDKAYQLTPQINDLMVAQFSYNQAFNSFTKSLQAKLNTIMSNRGMQVVERDQLEKVLKEQKLGYSGLINMNTAKKIGQLLGAQGMILGTVSDMGDNITINARLVDIEFGKTITASEVDLPKTPIIAQLLDKPVEDTSFVSGNSSMKNVQKKKGKSLHVTKVEGFTCELIECKKQDGIVKCDVAITNNKQDRQLVLFPNARGHVSRIIDNLSNEYTASSLQLGANKGKEYCKNTMISGIPIRAIITFEDMPQESKQALVIEIACSVRKSSTKYFSIQFRNVQFTK